MSDLVRGTVPSLIQGVSQQPDAQRDPSQGEAQVNGVSSVTDGLRPREGSRSIARLSVTPFTDAYIHEIQRDVTEQYLVVIAKTFIRVFDLQGNEKSVAIAAGALNYFSTVISASTDIRAATIADFTFISNSRRAPEMDPLLYPPTPRPSAHEALVWIKAANFGQTYRVNVNGTEASVTAPVAPVVVSGSTTTQNRVSTEEVAQQLATGLAGVPNVTITRVSSVLHLRSSSPITVAASDARANADITAITNSVGQFSELPAIAPRGYQVEILGDPSNAFDGYFVAFRPRDGAGDFGEGSWEESPAPGVPFRINAVTMPHVLVRLATGSFWFGPADGSVQGGTSIPKWGERSAGDEDTAQNPSFIGYPIQDVVIFKNRLTTTSDENLVASRARDSFEFFPETVTTVLDSDPIDRAASSNAVNVLRFAVPFQDELVLFSAQAQFRFGANESSLTPKSAEITALTFFEVDTNVRPVPVRGEVIFVQQNGQYSRLRNFFVRGAGTALVGDAGDLTEQASGYVPAGVFKLASNDSGNVIFALSGMQGHQNKIYVYKYFVRQSSDRSERVQSSWSHWEFVAADRILNMVCVEENLYLLVQYGSDVWLERISATDRLSDASPAPYPISLDRAVSTTPETPSAIRVPQGAYDPLTNTTSWVLPFGARERLQAWSGFSSSSNGGILLGEIASGDTVVARGDWATGNPPIWFGEQFAFSYTFSRPRLVEDGRNGGQVTPNEPRIQVRYVELRYARARYFRVVVELPGREPAVYVFDGATLGVIGSDVGSALTPAAASERFFHDGVFHVPVRSDGSRARITVVNDSIHPSQFLSMEWVGTVHSRARRLQ